MTHNENLLFMAREYVALGWHLVALYGVHDDLSCACGKPECSDTGKHPVPGQGVSHATTDLNKLEQWFAVKEARNLGIVAGAISGLTIIDIDMGPGKIGAQTWGELCREHGEPPTLRAVTGSGGMHVFFQYNSALKTSANTLGKHVDCRNDNGYVVAAPSKHRSGGMYTWDNWPHEQAALPAHLSRKKEGRGRPRKDDLLRGRYTIEQVRLMLEHVPADDRDLWRYVGIILGREFKRADEAWTVYVEWAAKWGGTKGRGHDANMRTCFYEKSQESSDAELSMGTLIKAAMEHGWVQKTGDVPMEDFIFYAPGEGNFLYGKTLDKWKASSVDVTVSPINVDGKVMKASDWLKIHRRATSLAHDPSIQEEFVHGVNCVNGELVPSVGAAVFNTYRRPTIALGDAEKADPFLKHCQLLFNKPGDCDQFLNYWGHLVQRAGDKLRFALMLTGEQGTGKDTTVEFCIPAIGSWNTANIDPAALASGFNEYAAATLIRISETANLQDMNKWALNESLKVLIAGSPDFCIVNPKFGHKFTVRLHGGVIITSNHLLSSIFIPEDDRRYDVIECATLAEMGLKPKDEAIAKVEGDEEQLAALVGQYARTRRDYFSNLWEWFHAKDGARHVAAYLHERSLTGFSAALGQRKTAAHKEVVHHGMIGDEWLRDIIDTSKYPDVLNGTWILERAVGMGEKKENVQARMGHALRRMGYEVLTNPGHGDGRWRLNGAQCRIYKKRGFTIEGTWQDCLEIPRSEAKDKSHGG